MNDTRNCGNPSPIFKLFVLQHFPLQIYINCRLKDVLKHLARDEKAAMIPTVLLLPTIVPYLKKKSYTFSSTTIMYRLDGIIPSANGNFVFLKGILFRFLWLRLSNPLPSTSQYLFQHTAQHPNPLSRGTMIHSLTFIIWYISTGPYQGFYRIVLGNPKRT